MTSTAGYSGTPLVRKLGVKPSFRIKTSSAPESYRQMLEPLPENVELSPNLSLPVDLWHIFAISRSDLESRLPESLGEIRQNGMIWVSWPKKASKISTDLTEDVVRELALPLGLVDVKVCAVDQIWSGLKLVIRRENRK